MQESIVQEVVNVFTLLKNDLMKLTLVATEEEKNKMKCNY